MNMKLNDNKSQLGIPQRRLHDALSPSSLISCAYNMATSLLIASEPYAAAAAAAAAGVDASSGAGSSGGDGSISVPRSPAARPPRCLREGAGGGHTCANARQACRPLNDSPRDGDGHRGRLAR